MKKLVLIVPLFIGLNTCAMNQQNPMSLDKFKSATQPIMQDLQKSIENDDLNKFNSRLEEYKTNVDLFFDSNQNQGYLKEHKKHLKSKIDELVELDRYALQGILAKKKLEVVRARFTEQRYILVCGIMGLISFGCLAIQKKFSIFTQNAFGYTAIFSFFIASYPERSMRFFSNESLSKLFSTIDSMEKTQSYFDSIKNRKIN